jgi:1-acyl-sn-glycerol-3-phosphate acyltransferase
MTGVKPFEPWTRFAESVLIPPLWAWFNWRFESLEHVPPEGPVLVACNHISYLDPLAHGYFLEKGKRRPRFLAKAELYRNPILRRVLRGAGQIPVHRGSGASAPVDAALRALNEGQVVVVYPEATVTQNEDFSPMQGKSGIARLALAGRVPVVPLATWGTQYVWPKEGVRSLRFGRPIWVKGGVPMDFSEHDDRADDPDVLRRVTDEVMAELSLLVEELRSRYPKRWS